MNTNTSEVSYTEFIIMLIVMIPEATVLIVLELIGGCLLLISGLCRVLRSAALEGFSCIDEARRRVISESVFGWYSYKSPNKLL